MFKKKDKPATLDLPPEPPKLHDLAGHKPAGPIDEELLPRKTKPRPLHTVPHKEELHDLPPLPDLDDDLPDLEPLSTEDHGLKSEDDLKLHDLPPLPKPAGRIKHPAPPPAMPPLHPDALPPMPKPPVHHAPPKPHFPKPAAMPPPMPKPPAHHAPPTIPKPHAIKPLPEPIDQPSFGDLFPEVGPAASSPEEKIIRDDAAFLSVLAFERVLEDLHISKSDLKHIHQYVSDISGYVGDEDKAYTSFREDIVDIQRRLAKMDKVLFAS